MCVRMCGNFWKCFSKIIFIKLLIDVRCDDLLSPANGEIVSCSSDSEGVGYEGDTCSFTCNTGYELTGSDTRTCQSDGGWSGNDDLCRRGKYNEDKTFAHVYLSYVY